MIKFNQKTVKFIILGFLLLIALYFLSIIYPIFTPFILAFFLAYLLEPIVEVLERRGVNRTWSILIIYVTLIGLITSVIFYGFPRLIIELNKFADTIPLYGQQLQGYILTLQQNYTRVDIPESIRTVTDDTIQELEGYLIELVRKIAQSFVQSFTKLLDIILAPILAFYLLKDFQHFKNVFLSFLPISYRKDFVTLGQQLDRLLKSFIRGHFIVALFVGGLTALGLTLVNMEFALVIGLLAGAFNIIPYFGPLMSIVPAVALAFLQSHTMAIYVFFIMIGIQQLESSVISPKILGKSLGLHPLMIILALLAGGHLYGLLGMIIAVPLTGILKVLLIFIINKLMEL